MGYVAVKGGAEAIEHAARFLEHERIKGGSDPLQARQIAEQLYLLVDRVMSEGSLYAPGLAALAIRQSAGDTLEASFMLRAYRATKSRIGYSLALPTRDMRIIRRISAAFKDIPGGQILGPTADYTVRLIELDLEQGRTEQKRSSLSELAGTLGVNDTLPDTFPKVIEALRSEGLLAERLTNQGECEGKEIFDITRRSMTFPAPRSAALQSLSRAETGGMLALAYSNMRGYGDVHPTVGELRVGYLPLVVKHPVTRRPYTAGEVKVTEAEVIARFSGADGTPRFTLGYGLCFGQNEVKAISMAVLDRALQNPEPQRPSEDQEFVLTHTDGIEAMGFCNHYKLPHYVTFQSDLDRIRKAQAMADPAKRSAAFGERE
jgi:alpha-D-ribose 1-methylphosphonate 5-triphosphate synthase subunit PhnI